MFVFFVFRKNDFIKSCLSSEDLSEYNISWSYVELCKFCMTSDVWTSAIWEWLQLQR
jgi:hypothetical protein